LWQKLLRRLIGISDLKLGEHSKTASGKRSAKSRNGLRCPQVGDASLRDYKATSAMTAGKEHTQYSKGG